MKTNIQKVSILKYSLFFYFSFQTKCVNINNNKTFQLYAQMLWQMTFLREKVNCVLWLASLNQFGFNYHYRIFLILSKPTLLDSKTLIDSFKKMLVFFHICGFCFLRILNISMICTSFSSSFSPSHSFLIHPNPS